MAQDPAKIVVKVFLAHRGKTQTWLARKMRVSHSLLVDVLAGRRAASPEFVTKLLTVTGIDLTQFPHKITGGIVLTGTKRRAVPTPDPESELVST